VRRTIQFLSQLAGYVLYLDQKRCVRTAFGSGVYDQRLDGFGKILAAQGAVRIILQQKSSPELVRGLNPYNLRSVLTTVGYRKFNFRYRIVLQGGRESARPLPFMKAVRNDAVFLMIPCEAPSAIP
jgi:hypothetical protein